MWATEDSHPLFITTVQVNGSIAAVITLKGPNEIAQSNALGNSTKNQVLKGRKVLFAGHYAPSGLFLMGDDYPGLSEAQPRAISFHPFGVSEPEVWAMEVSICRLTFTNSFFACTSGLYGTEGCVSHKLCVLLL